MADSNASLFTLLQQLSSSSPVVQSVIATTSSVSLHRSQRASNVQENERPFFDVIQEMNNADFSLHFRLTKDMVNELAESLALSTFHRYELTCIQQVYISLWYLANQCSYRIVAKQFNISTSHAHGIVGIFMAKLIRKYRPTIKLTQTLNAECPIPQVIGFIDGTHIPLKKPRTEPDLYYNRKSFWSINVMAVCNHDMQFIYYKIGAYGSAHDARVFRSSDLLEKLESLPHGLCILGDSAYPRSSRLLTAHVNPISDEQLSFNDNLKHARVKIEQSFALLKGQWRRLKYLDVDSISKAKQIIESCMLLQNFYISHQNA